MPRFFLAPECLDDASVVIDGENARHISLSLRMAVGDRLTLCDGVGTEYLCTIRAMDSKCVYADVTERRSASGEPPYRVTLYQCLPKGDKMDNLIQKAVECGVYRIVPVESRRCIVKISSDTVERKLARWQKIANEAAMQCGRGILPHVDRPMTFEKAVIRAASESCPERNGLSFLCYEGEGTLPLSHILRRPCPSEISFFVGPEGGIAPEETEFARNAGLLLAGLGQRILRTESASMFVLSGLSLAWEDGEF